MPRKDAEEEKEFAAKNEKDAEVQIVSDSQLTNLKLDKILENQLIILENQLTITSLLSSDPEEAPKD